MKMFPYRVREVNFGTYHAYSCSSCGSEYRCAIGGGHYGFVNIYSRMGNIILVAESRFAGSPDVKDELEKLLKTDVFIRYDNPDDIQKMCPYCHAYPVMHEFVEGGELKSMFILENSKTPISNKPAEGEWRLLVKRVIRKVLKFK